MEGQYRLSQTAHRVTFDWVLVALALIAGIAVGGLLIRTGGGEDYDQFGTHVGGLRALQETEGLVVFEEYGQDAGGWTGLPVNTEFLGLGGIVGPVPLGQTVSRSFILPEDAIRATIRFDLIALDDWALQPVSVSLGDEVVLQQSFSSRPETIDLMQSEVTASTGIRVATHPLAEAAERGFEAGSTAEMEQSVRVFLAVEMPEEELVLRLSGPDRSGPGPFWAIDNLLVVYERLP